ncbi:MAG: MarR family transcriptional regulator [Kordiimonadaceae bacterium]|jgi:DNA-binding MarR family transcriptional regulator|nr:MarR family transcriptional regulator [Kordiimonadaceae bacterium]MBT6036034.1 MarR family transcriptional regulator [Kordiimonadaceae bacterium]MBT6330974.1 MarR family transcriptional regulator [Kordiimonadaceae bacterium]
MADINLNNKLNKSDDQELFLKSTELLYFAYRDFIAWPDDILQTYGFGRAHHRVLFFVSQNPSMTVAELLKILSITKQSLSRVLSALIDKGYIVQEIGEKDRRQRLLNLTDKGKELLAQVSEHQKEQMLKALKVSGSDAVDGFWKVLTALINDDDRAEILELVFKNK